jgi:hypothetical protein
MLGVLVALGFGTQPMFTHAASINPNASPATATATYRLTSITSIAVPDANIPGPQVVAAILPPGSVVPPKLADGSEGSPLTILPDSHGFDPNHLVVALKDGTSSTGQPQQMFGLIFYGQGLQPDGLLHFTLSIDKALANNPPQLQSLTSGISITLDQPATTPPTDRGSGGGGGSTTGPTDNQIPEPLSVILWGSVLVGVAARRPLARRSRLRRISSRP